LELGGNGVLLVLDDADLEKVAPAVFSASMTNAGQICFATKRVY
jgi:acyl-CoA reductase-like NAD-dependent aldehyde dehydrogenase